MAQNTPNTPFARVTAGFGSKKDLVEKVKDLTSGEMWLARLNDAKPLSSISNTKLLRLHALITDAKTRFGSRDKLIEAIAAAEGRPKDADFRKHFAAWPLPRLMDALRSAEHRVSAAKKKTDAAAAPKPTRAPGEGAAAKAGAKKGAAKAPASAGAKKGAEGAKKGAAAPKAGAKKGAAGAGAKKGAAKK